MTAAPLIAYRLNDMVAIGGGPSFQYLRTQAFILDKDGVRVRREAENLMYGTRTFARFNLWKRLYAQSEFEYTNMELLREDGTAPQQQRQGNHPRHRSLLELARHRQNTQSETLHPTEAETYSLMAGPQDSYTLPQARLVLRYLSNGTEVMRKSIPLSHAAANGWEEGGRPVSVQALLPL